MPRKRERTERSRKRRESTQQTGQWRGGSCKTETQPKRAARPPRPRGPAALRVSTFSSAALRHFRFWSISLICSSISRQRLLVTVAGIAQARSWGGGKVKKDTARKQAARRKKKMFFKKWEENTTMDTEWGGWKGGTDTYAAALTLLNKAQKVPTGELFTSALGLRPPDRPHSTRGKAQVGTATAERQEAGFRWENPADPAS